MNVTEELINSIEDQRQYEINIKMISPRRVDESGATLMRMPADNPIWVPYPQVTFYINDLSAGLVLALHASAT